MPKKTEALTKRIKIDKAQQNMLIAVGGASIVLGVCLVLAVYFLKYIRFNMVVIEEKEKAISGYSETIENIGVCKKPSGKIYTTEELNKCDPNDISVYDVPDTLRYNVIVNMSQNSALESVARDSLSICYNSSTRQKLTFSELYNQYESATDEDAKSYYLELISMCTALRAIPDALPASKNEFALMASLNMIFNESNWPPKSLTPGGETETALSSMNGISVGLSIETDAATTRNVIANIERSIREFNISSATIEWTSGSGGEARLSVNARATAYYIKKAAISENLLTIDKNLKVTDKTESEEE